MVMNGKQVVLRSKKNRVLATQQLKLVGQFDISGTRPPQAGEEPFMMVQLVGFGVDIWIRVASDVPRVEGADSVILQCRLAKTKSKKFAVTPFALLSISLDGDQVWEGEAVEDRQGSEDVDETPAKAVPDRLPGSPAKQAAR